jgi:hypothetical protein
MIGRILGAVLELAETPEAPDLNAATRRAIDALGDIPLKAESGPWFGTLAKPTLVEHKCERVIQPGSKGLNIRRNNAEFEVEAVFFHPRIAGLSYRSRYASSVDDTVKDIIPVSHLVEIPGESEVGLYDYDTGEIRSASLLETAKPEAPQSVESEEPRSVSTPPSEKASELESTVPKDKTHLIPAEARRLLDKSSDGLREMIARGELTREKVNGRWLIPARDVERLLELPYESRETSEEPNVPLQDRKPKTSKKRRKKRRSRNNEIRTANIGKVSATGAEMRALEAAVESLENRMKFIDDEIWRNQTGLLNDAKRSRLRKLKLQKKKYGKRLQKAKSELSKYKERHLRRYHRGE